MPKLLCAPHNDDESLFAAVLCLRERPHVLICLDSHIQPNRGERGCGADQRFEESKKACAILGCEVSRLGIPDDLPLDGDSGMEAALEKQLSDFHQDDIQVVYAPAIQGGNPHHDLVGKVALKVFGSKVMQYATYTKTELYTTGDVEIVPTAEELEIKKRALECYESQLRINLAHFTAVMGKSEWLIHPPKALHLGCGHNKIEGWINLDKSAVGDIQADVLQGLPFADSSFDRIASQDFLEHLPPESRVSVVNEMWRVLKNGGTMEHLIPNAGSRNDYGSPTHLSHWNLQCFEHFDVDSYRWEKDRHYEGFIGGFKKVKAELVNWQDEEDGIKRAQSIHVKYAAVK